MDAEAAQMTEPIVRDYAYPRDDPRFSGKHTHASPEEGDAGSDTDSDPWSSFESGGPSRAQAGEDGSAASGAILGRASALYDFDAENPTELSFAEGDMLHIIYKQCDGWLVGYKKDHVGLIPENYVKMVDSSK